MSFNAGSITTSLSFELSASGKSALKNYEAALARAKKSGHVTAKLDAKADTAGFDKFDRSQRQTTKTTQRTKQTNDQLGKSYRQLGKQAVIAGGGALALAKSFSYLKGAVNETEDLTKASLKMSAIVKMDVKQSAQWIMLAKQRGLESKQLNMGFITLSKNMDAANNGGDKQMAMFKKLGVSQEMLKRGNASEVMLQTADAFKKMGPGAERSTIMQKLFSRSGQGMIGVLAKGKKGLEEQLAVFDKQSGTISKNEKTTMASVKAQKALDASMLNLKLTVGTALMPMMKSLADVMTKLSSVSPGLLKVLGGLAVGAVAAVYLSKVVTALKVLGGAFKIAGLAARAFGVSSTLALGPIGIAIMAAVVIIGLIIWKWKDVKKIVGAVWKWMKNAAEDVFGYLKWAAKNGLLGPALLIISRWGQVKSFLGKTWNWMKEAGSNAFSFLKKIITSYIGFYTSMPGKIGRALAGIFGKISSPFIKAFNAIKKAATDAFNWVKDKAKNSLPGKVIGKIGGFLGLSEGGKVGPGAGGPKMYVAGEGGKAEWVVSQEGDRKKNIGFALDALQSLGVPMFAKGGIASGKKSITNLQRLESLKEQDISRMGAEAGIDGVTTPAESQAILDQKASLSTLYRTEQDAVLRVLALINSERSAVKQDMRGTKGNKRQKLADKLANLDGDKSTYAGRKGELRGILGQAAAEIATGNNDLLALAAVDTSADGSIQAARDAMLLDEVAGRDTAGDKKTLAGAIRKRVDELTARFRTASGPSRAAIGDALSSSFSEWKGLQDDTSASSSSLGFSQQVSNLTSARTSMYQSAGNAVGGTTVNLAVNGLQTTSDPHLFARRVQAELALI